MRDNLLKLGLFLLTLFLAWPGVAQDNSHKVSFSLAEAQQYAVEHNRTLANASLDVQKAQAVKWQRIAALLPQVSASSSYSNSLGYKMDLGPMKISMTPYMTFNISTTVALSGAQIVSLGIADISRRMADITQEKTERQISDQVETLYFSALVTEETLRSYLSTRDYPDPDLLIRTGGELRISNFLLWQMAYTELYFSDQLWPDFRHEAFYDAIYDYQNRQRRFGKTGDQVSKQ